MALRLRFDLRLQSRQPESVVVSVVLEPLGDPAQLEGVSLQILGSRGETVSARMVLPISGALAHPMVSTLELRALDDTIPPRCRVVGTAWNAQDTLEASIPTDPFTELQSYVQGLRRVGMDGEAEPLAELERLAPEERERVAELYPWVEQPRVPKATAQLTVVDHEPSDEEALDSLLDELGIDEESADWLKGLMDEPEGD